ncbi:MAG TPA: hypothetical protein VHL31_21415 [Geminicoccus sp.]|uniref:hypothetical protein n=1 Tax=Geminicoccus sp. TaxID=2024832 RepID=UPI002E309E5A|nr:hypothetical protein [Geminicoccus sp.]HEX2528838.1 hypothetical protein [Geminicoccus sp.]
MLIIARSSRSPAATGVLALGSKIGRAFARFCAYVQTRQTNALFDLTEHQLRDIGADAETVAHVVETRTLNSFRGPGGRIWVQLMHRGPGT